MRAVIQRVRSAKVEVDNAVVGRVKRGYLVLLGVERDDAESDAQYMADKIAGLRVFEDDEGKMNRAITDVEGEVLLVSQFTLYGDARKGRRPSFIRAALPDKAIPLLATVKQRLEEHAIRVEEGIFGADMLVSLENDGPVTILLDSAKEF